MLYELTNVRLRYGARTALSIASLGIARGERVALLGPNGSGKTSLLKLMDGLVCPSEGSVLLEGRAVDKAAGSRPRSVYLHQYPYLLSGTVAYNVGFGCRALGLPHRETRRRAEEAIARLGLEGMEGRGHRALSGGEAQRVALARAMAAGAEILLLDEPSASADAESTELIAAALRGTAAAGTTVVFSTHDEEFARRLEPRTLRLRAGTIIEENGGQP